MKSNLSVVLLQNSLLWEDISGNLHSFDRQIAQLDRTVDLIVLPEMFTTGFSMNASRVSDTMEGKGVTWMQKLAAHKNCAVAGSLIIKERAHFFNRFIFCTPDGTIKHYDKRHLFTLGHEHLTYKAGTDQVQIVYKGWKIKPLICYDLRFPVWSRNVNDDDLYIYVANWPSPRVNAWDTLLKARAIENMVFSIGVNRTGTDQNNLEYPGHSAIYDPLGEQLTTLSEEPILIYKTLDIEMLHQVRSKLQFLNDRDDFTIMK